MDDTWYRPRVDLPATATMMDFAGTPCSITITDTDPGSTAAQWMPDRDVTLTVRDDVGAAALSAVLPLFLAFAHSVADRPAQASMTLPSRDIERCRVVREAGFPPTVTLAIADLERVPIPDTDLPGITIRDARPEDADALAALVQQQAEYEVRVGSFRLSPRIRASIAGDVPGLIADEGDTLIAERDGTAVATCIAQSPAASAWATARITADPVSYLAIASTSPAQRGAGLGTALVHEHHRRLRAQQVQASVLHYGTYNPLSVPFWSQRGYRPLLTTFGRNLVQLP